MCHFPQQCKHKKGQRLANRKNLNAKMDSVIGRISFLLIERFIFYKSNNPPTEKVKVMKFNPYLSSSIHPSKCGYTEKVIIFVIETENLIISNLDRKIIEKIPLQDIKKVIYSQDSKDLIQKLIQKKARMNSGNSPTSIRTGTSLTKAQAEDKDSCNNLFIEFALITANKKRINLIIRG